MIVSRQEQDVARIAAHAQRHLGDEPDPQH
jgi:hypothetical protein